MPRAIVSLSGGMDSTALLDYVTAGRTAIAVGFQYGSKHNRYEHQAAYAVAQHYGVPFKMIDLTSVMENFKSALMMKDDAEVPEGHYEAETMRQTVVPGRNIIFASILAGVAWSEGAEQIYMGVHAGDHYIYPDCRPEFIDAMNEAVYRGTGGKVGLLAPFLHKDKTWIVGKGLENRVPFHLTRTCYKDQTIACGKCGSCQERLEAFKNNGVDDPIEYESRELLPK
jgi:7-cyano-7-deazaguanine synthase